jgi:DHA1 family multidrug resistance protein-like MFS transporter
VLPLALVAACAELGIAILNNSTLPVYYRYGLKISIFLYPVIMIPFFVSEALFKLPLGHLSDRFGRKPLIVGGALVTVFTPFILIHLHTHGLAVGVSVMILLGFLRLLDGLGGAALWPAVYSYVGDYVEENKRGAAMGLLNMVYMVGLAVSFLVGGLVDDNFGPVFTGESTLRGQVRQVAHRIKAVGRHYWDTMHHQINPSPMPAPMPLPVPAEMTHPGHYFPSFYLASLLFAIAAIIATVMLKGKVRKVNEHGEHHEEEHTWEGFVAAVKCVPQYLLLAFVTFAGIGCIAPLVKIFALEEFHLTETEVGIMTLWPAFFIAAIAVPVGHLADKWGKSHGGPNRLSAYAPLGPVGNSNPALAARAQRIRLCSLGNGHGFGLCSRVPIVDVSADHAFQRRQARNRSWRS